jgi:hypothetical protein
MTQSTSFVPAANSDGAGLCYAEHARSGRGLFMVLQDLSPRPSPARMGFIRAAYREIVARYQSVHHPETPTALLRGVERVLDGTARQVESRLDDFRGLGLFVLAVDGDRAYLLCSRAVPARARVGGVLLSVATGVAGGTVVSF